MATAGADGPHDPSGISVCVRSVTQSQHERDYGEHQEH